MVSPRTPAAPGAFTLWNDTPVWDANPPAGPAVQLRWTASSNVTSYEVYRNGSKLYPSSGTFTGTTFNNNLGLTSGQSYTYMVLAKNASGSTQSNTITVGPMPGAPAPVPGSFTLWNDAPVWDTNPPAGPAVQLRWTASSNVTSYEVFRNGSKIYPSSGTFAGTTFNNNLGLTSGQSYTYLVLAKNASGSTQSNTITVGPMPSAPAPVPGSFTLWNDAPVWDTNPPAGPAVQLRWSASSNVTSYEVYRNGSKIYPSSGTFTGTSFSNNAGLTSGQSYTYMVLAKNASGSTPSNTITVGPMPSPPAPVPGSFTLWNDAPVWDTNPPAGPAVQLRWSASGNVTSYEVYRNGSKIYPSSGTFTGTTFKNNIGLTAGQSYTYVVLAKNASGSTQSNTITVGPMPAASTPAPGAFSLWNDVPVWDSNPPAGPAVVLRWTASGNVTGYEVYRNGTRIYPSSGTFAGRVFYNTVGLVSGQSYTYMVVAKNGTGSTPSNSITVGPMPSSPGTAPSGFALGNDPPVWDANPPAGPAVQLRWTPSATATDYVVYRSGTRIYPPSGTFTRTTFYSSFGMTSGQSYTYVVVANNAAGSTQSNTITVGPMPSAPSAPVTSPCSSAATLREKIAGVLRELAARPAPEYLPGSAGWRSLVLTLGTVWGGKIAAYDELYFMGLRASSLAADNLILAGKEVDLGRLEGACRAYSTALRMQIQSTMAFAESSKVWEKGATDTTRFLLNTVNASCLALKLGTKSGLLGDVLCTVTEYSLEAYAFGTEFDKMGFTSDVVRSATYDAILHGFKPPELGGRSFAEWLEHGVSKLVGNPTVYGVLQRSVRNGETATALSAYLGRASQHLPKASIEWLVSKIESGLDAAIDSLTNRNTNRDMVTLDSACGSCPRVISASPDRLALNVQTTLSEIVTSYDLPVSMGTGAPVLAGDGVSWTLRFARTNGLSVVWSLPDTLRAASTYSIDLPSGLVRAADTGANSEQVGWTFTTQSLAIAAGARLTVANTGGAGLSLRTGASLGSPAMALLPDDSQCAATGLTAQADGFTWYQCSTSLGTGWAALGQWLVPTDPSGLHAGAGATVENTIGLGLRLRDSASLAGSVLTVLPDHTSVSIVGGPFFQDGYLFWLVSSTAGSGYAGTAPWLEAGLAPSSAGSLCLTGSLDFGNTPLGGSASKFFTIFNGSNAAAAISRVAYPGGFRGNWSEGVIPSGGSVIVTVTFSPTGSGSYGGTIGVIGDQIGGTSTIAVSGTAVAGPTILRNPESAALGAGDPGMISVAASGSAPLFYQWYSGTTPSSMVAVPGATSSVLSLQGSSMATRYRVVVADSLGAATTSTAAVVAPPLEMLAATPGTAPVRLSHLLELRRRIDALRIWYGLEEYSWSDPTPIAGSTVIRAQHFVDLRTALSQAYVASGRTAPIYTDPTLAAGATTVRASHIRELCTAVIALE